MNEKRKTLTIPLDDKNIEVTVVRSTTGIGVKRSLMAFKAIGEHEEAKKAGMLIDEARYVLGYRTLPDLVCGTVEVKGMEFPISLDTLYDLPEEFVEQWINAVYGMNPHWNPERLVTEEMKVKKSE